MQKLTWPELIKTYNPELRLLRAIVVQAIVDYKFSTNEFVQADAKRFLHSLGHKSDAAIDRVHALYKEVEKSNE